MSLESAAVVTSPLVDWVLLPTGLGASLPYFAETDEWEWGWLGLPPNL